MLNALTTRAPGHERLDPLRAGVGAPETVASGPGPTGLVQSTRTFPRSAARDAGEDLRVGLEGRREEDDLGRPRPPRRAAATSSAGVPGEAPSSRLATPASGAASVTWCPRRCRWSASGRPHVAVSDERDLHAAHRAQRFDDEAGRGRGAGVLLLAGDEAARRAPRTSRKAPGRRRSSCPRSSAPRPRSRTAGCACRRSCPRTAPRCREAGPGLPFDEQLRRSRASSRAAAQVPWQTRAVTLPRLVEVGHQLLDLRVAPEGDHRRLAAGHEDARRSPATFDVRRASSALEQRDVRGRLLEAEARGGRAPSSRSRPRGRCSRRPGARRRPGLRISTS